jgi:hypothetical protein
LVKLGWNQIVGGMVFFQQAQGKRDWHLSARGSVDAADGSGQVFSDEVVEFHPGGEFLDMTVGEEDLLIVAEQFLRAAHGAVAVADALGIGFS